MEKKREPYGGGLYRPSAKLLKPTGRGRGRGVEFPRVEEARQFLSQGGQFIAIGMPPGSQQRDLDLWDTDLGKTKQITAAVIHQTVAGKEPRAAWREFGVPPAVTFTRPFECPPGGLFNIASSWKRGGMPTLCANLVLSPPQGEEQRRAACYFGVGEAVTQTHIEGMCVDWLDPCAWSKGFGPESFDGVARFYLMVEMFRPEVATFLGLPVDSAEMDAFWEVLVENAEATANVPEKEEAKPTHSQSWGFKKKSA